MKTHMRVRLSFALLALLLAAFAVWNIGLGSVAVTAGELLEVLMGRGENPAMSRIIWDIRLPRMMAAAILGGALSVSGFLLQTFFANPIAGPFVLGISSGREAGGLSRDGISFSGKRIVHGLRRYDSGGLRRFHDFHGLYSSDFP